MKRTKEIGYELLRVVDMDGFMELWNRTSTETKDKIVNGIGELAVRLVSGADTRTEPALPIQNVSGSLPTSEELQEIVVKIAYSQQGEEQSSDCYAKMGMLHEFISKYVNGNGR